MILGPVKQREYLGFYPFFSKEVWVISLCVQCYHAFDDSVPSEYAKENTKYNLCLKFNHKRLHNTESEDQNMQPDL